MLNQQERTVILELYKKQNSVRTISKLLNLSRNTVKKIIHSGVDVKKSAALDERELSPIVKSLFTRCKGNVVRVQEILQDEYDTKVAYSTLTRWVRECDARGTPKRAGTYHFEPGEEMQHDTSPHKIKIGDKEVKAQCASLTFAYSRQLFMCYYPCFTRFEAKSFLKDALEFMGGSCKRCVIDNTNVILAAGSGADAVFSQEMSTFARLFGFTFMAHAIDHADRKARVERPFYYIETNFLAGRIFTDWEDLNQQARLWCINVANQKEKRATGMTPTAAFIQEKPYLNPLPQVMPPVYAHYLRIVDSGAYINLDTNSYSVPEKYIRKSLDVYKYPTQVRIFYQHEEIATHQRLIGKRYTRATIKGHHKDLHRRCNRSAPCESEVQLRGHQAILDVYIERLKKQVRGRGMWKFNRLLNLKRTYPEDAFVAALKQAVHYGLYDLTRLEELIINYAAGHYFNLRQEDTE